MSAFFVALTTIKNPEKLKEYLVKATTTITTHGGEFIIRGKFASALAGFGDHQAVAIVKFPTMNDLTKWYESADRNNFYKRPTSCINCNSCSND